MCCHRAFGKRVIEAVWLKTRVLNMKSSGACRYVYGRENSATGVWQMARARWLPLPELDCGLGTALMASPLSSVEENGMRRQYLLADGGVLVTRHESEFHFRKTQVIQLWEKSGRDRSKQKLHRQAALTGNGEQIVEGWRAAGR